METKKKRLTLDLDLTFSASAEGHCRAQRRQHAWVLPRLPSTGS